MTASLGSLVTMLEARGHSLRVHELVLEMAEHFCGVSRVSKELAAAAQLHDIGKVGIRDAVLKKVGKVTEEETNHIREHPVIGQGILRRMQGRWWGSFATTTNASTGSVILPGCPEARFR